MNFSELIDYIQKWPIVTSVIIATLSLIVSILAFFRPAFGTIIRFLCHHYRRCRQTRRIRKIVQVGIRNIRANYPNCRTGIIPHGTSITREQVEQNEQLKNILINKVRFENYVEMMDELKVVLEHYSSDLPPERRSEIKDPWSRADNTVLFKVSPPVLMEVVTTEPIETYPTLEFYEEYVIPLFGEIDWLKLKL